MSRPTILQLLAHGPATRFELAVLAGRNIELLPDLFWDRLESQGIVKADGGIYSITDKGRDALPLILEAARRQALDAACEGVR